MVAPVGGGVGAASRGPSSTAHVFTALQSLSNCLVGWYWEEPLVFSKKDRLPNVLKL